MKRRFKLLLMGAAAVALAIGGAIAWQDPLPQCGCGCGNEILDCYTPNHYKCQLNNPVGG